jgi:hypothetical protein
MELPANPADILYGIYNQQGINTLKQQQIDEEEYIRQLFNSSTGTPPRGHDPLAIADDSAEIPFYGYNMGIFEQEGGIF